MHQLKTLIISLLCKYIVAKKWELPLFEKSRAELLQRDRVHAPDFLEGLGDACRWTMHADGGHRWGHETTNIAEAVNGVLRGARNLPILALVMTTMHKTLGWYEQRLTDYAKFLSEGKTVFNRIHTYLEQEGKTSRNMTCFTYNRLEGRYEVQLSPSLSPGHALTVYRVDIGNRTCDCGKFQALRLPCSHALTACRASRIDPLTLVDPYYTIEKSLEAYQGQWFPLGDISLWPECGVTWVPDPNRERVCKGRPVSTRIHNDMDMRYGQEGAVERTQNHCGKCGELGHNRLTCDRRRTTREN